MIAKSEQKVTPLRRGWPARPVDDVTGIPRQPGVEVFLFQAREHRGRIAEPPSERGGTGRLLKLPCMSWLHESPRIAARDLRLLAPANLLSLARIPLGVVFMAVVDQPAAAIAVMGVAGLTDVLDGWLARRTRGPSHLQHPDAAGSWLDPVCDKLFLAAVLIAVYASRHPPLAVVVMIAARELVVVPATAVYRLAPGVRRRLRCDFRASRLGKAATVTQFAAVVALLLAPAAVAPLASTAAVVGLLAAADYLRRAAPAVRVARRAPEPE